MNGVNAPVHCLKKAMYSICYTIDITIIALDSWVPDHCYCISVSPYDCWQACCNKLFIPQMLPADWWVASTTTRGALPASYACDHLEAHKHQQSFSLSPAKPYSGIGVDKSFPTDLENSRNSAVIRQHTVCDPISPWHVQGQKTWVYKDNRG